MLLEFEVSRYEGYFDAKRQLNEEHALGEMEISENGPNLPNANKILLSAVNKYSQSKKSSDSSWHFCHKSDDVRTYSTSKVVQKLLKFKSKFPFVDT